MLDGLLEMEEEEEYMESILLFLCLVKVMIGRMDRILKWRTCMFEWTSSNSVLFLHPFIRM